MSHCIIFQENKSFGASYHLHSSSDVHEAVSGTVRLGHSGLLDFCPVCLTIFRVK
jgi:hypothetical protein